MLIIRRSKLYYTASGIITPVGGRPMHLCTYTALTSCNQRDTVAQRFLMCKFQISLILEIINIFELVFVYLFVINVEGLPLYCWQNDIDRENRSTRRNVCPSATSCIMNLARSGQELNTETATVEAGNSKHRYPAENPMLISLTKHSELTLFRNYF